MTIRERYKRTIGYFRNNNPDPDTELDYKNPFELIVAVILSAQCTDKRVNMIMPPLMEKFPDAASMAGAKPEELFEYIRSCSYPNNKARHLSGMSKLLTEEFGGKVPSEPSLLQKLPGVGRKTANVVASVLFKKPVMAVDTHVFRVANRIGLTVAKNPISSEIQLTRHIPADLVHKAHHWLLLHGRDICKSRKPLCSMCGLSDFCKYYIKNSGLKAK